jgi:S1-C subfamily serine protease
VGDPSERAGEGATLPTQVNDGNVAEPTAGVGGTPKKAATSMPTKLVAVVTAISFGLPVAAHAAQKSKANFPMAEQSQSFGAGVTVDEVVPHTAAAAAGIRRGDVVVSINGMPVNGFPDIDAQVTASGGRTLVIDLYRRGRHLRLRAAPRPSAGLYAYGVPQQGRAIGLAHWESRVILMPCADDPDCE